MRRTGQPMKFRGKKDFFGYLKRLGAEPAQPGEMAGNNRKLGWPALSGAINVYVAAERGAKQAPAGADLAAKLYADLKRRGFTFPAQFEEVRPLVTKEIFRVFRDRQWGGWRGGKGAPRRRSTPSKDRRPWSSKTGISTSDAKEIRERAIASLLARGEPIRLYRFNRPRKTVEARMEPAKRLGFVKGKGQPSKKPRP